MMEKSAITKIYTKGAFLKWESHGEEVEETGKSTIFSAVHSGISGFKMIG